MSAGEFDQQGATSEVETTLTFASDLVADKTSELTSEEAAAIAALPTGSALLVVIKGPNDGARFLLDQEVTTVGRHPNADIFLDDVTVSRRHAEFVRKDKAFLVRDLGSLNGTYRDGRSVEVVQLNDGDEVQIGKFRMTFFASPADLGGVA
ncbi:MAG: FHA domain-containing protein [Actinomycetales bacterium]|nr:FHA domain-containing protein [Actinomycetales bacterium]